MSYKFKGYITSVKDYDIPFEVADGIAIFNLESKLSNEEIILLKTDNGDNVVGIS